jgi:hypothetical protein
VFDFIWKIRYTSGTSYEGYEASPLTTPAAWQSITYGLIETFVRWQLQQGYAIGSINVWLATIKKYCALATKAGSKASQHTMGDMPGPPLPFVEEQTSKRGKMLGGWKSIAMSARYATSQKIANKGVVSGK